MNSAKIRLGSAVGALALLTPEALAQTDIQSTFELARGHANEGNTSATERTLSVLSIVSLSPSQQALYYEILAIAYKDIDPSQSARYYQSASELEERAYRKYEQALAHERASETVQALEAYEQALALEPGNRTIGLSYAYALRRAGRDSEAAGLFARFQDDSPQLLLDEAYANLAARQSDQAVEGFKAALDTWRETGTYDEVGAYGIRREVQRLEDRLNGQVFVSYRENSFETPIALPEEGVSLGQLGAQISYQPEATYNAGEGLSVFARGYASFEDGSLNADEDSVQFGVGANWKPLQSQNLNFAFERMIAGGDNARDAWLARAQYGWGQGFDWQPGQDHWAYTSVYAGLSHILDEPTFTSLYTSIRHGRRFAVADKVAITPYITAVAQWSEDEFDSRERYEAGPGVALSIWTNETEYWAPSQRIDFEIEYRVAGGDSDDSFVGQIVWNF